MIARVAFVALTLPLVACSAETSSSTSATTMGSGGGFEPNPDAKEEVVVTHPDRPPLPGETECTVTVTTNIPIASAKHLPLCTAVDYATNPPSGGEHWPEWAAFKEYAAPVPREMYVHDLEHGAVAFLYRCDDGCPEVVGALRGAYDSLPQDPVCEGAGVAARRLLTPDPKLATPIALAAWGATYTATCIDPPSLAEFAKEHYGEGPEEVCAPGRDLEASGPPACSG